MKKFFAIPVAALAIISAVSCNKETKVSQEIQADEATLTVKVKGLIQTKGTPDVATIEGEDNINSLEIFVFPSEGGLLEEYHKATSDEIDGNTATASFKCKTGSKHVYALVNASIAESVEVEDDLLAAVSEFSGNSSGNFIMAGSGKDASGSYEPTLAAGGSNSVSVEVRRIVGRVKIENIQASFESPALQQNDFVVKRVYLMNVAKQARYFNGNWNDVFGIESRGTVTDSPEGFTPAATVGEYYFYETPASDGSSDNGLYNWEDHTTFLVSDVVGIDESVADMTSAEFSASEGALYSSDGNALENNTMTLNKYFYAYPNSSAPAEDASTVDYTTKLVIETEYTTSSGTSTTYYYPLSIPYIQPNYAYTIGSVVLKRLGNRTPFLPVTTVDCTFTVTVKDWETGDIIGQWNNEVSDDDFEI